MHRITETSSTEEPILEISQEMLERLTRIAQVARNLPDAAGEVLQGESLREVWDSYGHILASSEKAAFKKPVDVQKMSEAIFSQSELTQPVRKTELGSFWRSSRLQKWAALATTVTAVLTLAVIGVFMQEEVVVEPLEDISWETSIAEEIDEMAETLENLDEGWSTFDMELAIVDTRLDAMFDTLWEEEWEEDYF